MEKTYREGHFVWRELMTSDVEKAKAFYGPLLGWTFEDMPMPMGIYTLAKKDGENVAGMMVLPPGAPSPPAWLSYVSTSNVDACLDAVKANGGSVAVPAEDIPGVGRFAVMLDATGGALGLLCSSEGDMPGGGRPGKGQFCWETFMTTDIAKAKAFFSAVIGWKDVPGPGDSTVMKAGEAMVCDFSAAPPGAPSHWAVHVVIEDLETARAQAEKAGAKVLVPEIKVPSVGRMTFVSDPTGAVISLFEPDMSSAPAA